MPRPLRASLGQHTVSFVEREGWKGKLNGELLGLVADAFDVFLTSDASFPHQNDLSGRGLSVIILPTNNLDILRLSAPAIRATLDDLAFGSDNPALVTIRWNGRRTIRNLDRPGNEERELPPVPRFGRNPSSI